MKEAKKRGVDGDEVVKRLYAAVADYVKERGGSVIAIGGIELQQWPEDNEFVYRMGIKFIGKKPEVFE